MWRRPRRRGVLRRRRRRRCRHRSNPSPPPFLAKTFRRFHLVSRRFEKSPTRGRQRLRICARVNQQLRAEIRKEKAAREETEAIAKMRANGEEREYEAQISALRKNVERLREDYNRIQAETENVHSHNESLRDIKLAYASLKGAWWCLMKRKKSFLTDRDELKRRCDSLQRHLVDALERYEKLDAEKTSLEGENEKLSYDVELLSSAETENAQLKSKIAELQKELESCSDAELRDEVKRLTVREQLNF